MDSISEIAYDEAVAFLLPRHYSGRKPVVSKASILIVDKPDLSVQMNTGSRCRILFRRRSGC